MTRTKPRPARTPARPTSRWTPMVISLSLLAVAGLVGAVWVQRENDRREREHRREVDQIVREGNREAERLFTKSEREEIDRAVEESARKAEQRR